MRAGNRILAMALAPLLMAGCSVNTRNGASAAGAPHQNVRYTIEGQPVQLVDGIAEEEGAPGSASKVVTRFFGNVLRKDLNGDGREDVAGLLTQDRGGSGAFFYVVAALQTDSGYVGSDGLPLGDRIAPQAITSGPSRSIFVSYAEHAPAEPMAAPPSRARRLQLLLNPQTLRFGEVVQGFEGEADPARMTLSMKPWTWVRAQYNDGRAIAPRQPGRFTLTLLPDGTFSAATDCNRLSGRYTASQGGISFGEMASTKMYCEASQEAEFASLLREAQRHHFTSRGELIFDLKFDSGVVVFR